MMENRYYEFSDALKVASKRLDDDQLLTDTNNEQWDIFNLMEQDNALLGVATGQGTYYVVGLTGSIGITYDDGYSVDWLYKAG